MAITQSTPCLAAASLPSASQTQVVRTTHTTLRYLYGIVPIVAGADKFTNLIAQWKDYLNPLVLRIVPLSPSAFMSVVGGVEISAGLLVLIKPRLGALVVMAWLLAISLQLIVWGQHLDVAVRDIVMALGGALTLARLTPVLETEKIASRS